MTNTSKVNARNFAPHFSVYQLRSKKAQDFGSGNWAAFKAAARQLAAAGVKRMCIQPIHELASTMASYFSRTSMNALSHRLLDLTEVPGIKNSPRLARQVRKELANYAAHSKMAGTDFRSVETEHSLILARAYDEFSSLPKNAPRQKQFNSFCRKHSWWLDKYAYFMTLKEDYRGIPMEIWPRELADMTSGRAVDYIAKKESRINYYKYVQMECYRQAREALAYAKALGIEEIEGQVGVGIARESAEGFLMRDKFDFARQIGCFPEPKTSDPVQLWGFLAERDNEALLDFKVKSIENFHALGFDRIDLDHSAGFLGGYNTFPVYDPGLLAKGIYRVLDAKDPRDVKIAEEGGQWAIPLQQEERREAYARKVLFSLLARIPGMKFSAETVGDWLRRVSAEKAINAAIDRGHDFTLMRALPAWETEALGNYRPVDRLSLTHDMPALTGLLTGQAGDYIFDWVKSPVVGKFLNRLGILAPGLDRPLKVSELTTELMMEVHRRIMSGSTAGTVSLPLSSLFTLLPAYLDSEKWQYTNIKPGTPGEIGNALGNWEQRLPEIENLGPAAKLIRELAKREHRPFGEVWDFIPATNYQGFAAQSKIIASESVAYRAADGKWTVWQAGKKEKPLRELAITYNGPTQPGTKAFARFNLNGWGFETGRTYTFLDLVSGARYKKTGEQLEQEGGLLVALSTGSAKKPGSNRHHFVVLAER
jgi:hypothetical protein